jgi:Fe-S-cluster containining protein
MDGYRDLLERLDEWFAHGRRAAPVAVPCRGGCTACCHGPFDISIADAELVSDAVSRLPAGDRDAVVRRAAALLARMRAIEPGWEPPYEVAPLGDDRFDRLSETLATEPCPLLDEAGHCRIYADRPLVCRLIGLGMLYLFLVGIPMQIVAALITLSGTVLYPGYSVAPRTWGLSPLDDQQLGGLLMWVPGNLYMFLVIGVLFLMWSRENR